MVTFTWVATPGPVLWMVSRVVPRPISSMVGSPSSLIVTSAACERCIARPARRKPTKARARPARASQFAASQLRTLLSNAALRVLVEE
jgi:hypothetical protein